MPSTIAITVSQLSRLPGLPQTSIIVDLRGRGEFAADPSLIPGAQPALFQFNPALLHQEITTCPNFFR